MLNLFSRGSRNCEGVSRRSFLQVGALGGLGLGLPEMLAARSRAAAATGGSPDSGDVNCILVWTLGGTSHHDTFDPKPEAPDSIRGEYGVIDTAVPGVQFSEIVPNMARELGRFSLLRNWNPKNGSHGMADQWVMSGRRFNASVAYPTYGSVVSWHKGFRTALPPFVQLGSSVSQVFGGGTAGVLGLEHNPFVMLSDPNAAKLNVRDISPPGGISMDRISRRKNVLARIDGLQRAGDAQPRQYEALDEHYRAALNMITAPETKRAFAIDTEDDKLRDQYGRNRFGQSCLLARRLIESGVRFVTVSDGGWDTHTNNFKSLKDRLVPKVDQALPALLADLEDRGMLDNTFVIWLTDFGRTPKVNSASGRDHWASSGFAIAAGAGVPGGTVIGATDAEGARPAGDEYYSEDIGMTVYDKLHIPHEATAISPDGRPVRLLEGNVIREWS